MFTFTEPWCPGCPDNNGDRMLVQVVLLLLALIYSMWEDYVPKAKV